MDVQDGELQILGTVCVVYRKACVYPCRRLLSSCSRNLIFRMCFLNPSICLSFRRQLSLSGAAACGGHIAKIKNGSGHQPALLTPRESPVGHPSPFVEAGLWALFRNAGGFVSKLSEGVALVVTFRFTR